MQHRLKTSPLCDRHRKRLCSLKCYGSDFIQVESTFVLEPNMNHQQLHHPCQHASQIIDKLANRWKVTCPAPRNVLDMVAEHQSLPRNVTELSGGHLLCSSPREQWARKWTVWLCKALVPAWIMTQSCVCSHADSKIKVTTPVSWVTRGFYPFCLVTPSRERCPFETPWHTHTYRMSKEWFSHLAGAWIHKAKILTLLSFNHLAIIFE